MLAVILKLFSILGIVLLFALGILLLLLLLVLFMPIVYRIKASKDAATVEAAIRIWWLFGLVKAIFLYPAPGTIVLKVLGFTIYDSGKLAAKNTKEQADKGKAKNGATTTKEEITDKVLEESGNTEQTAQAKEKASQKTTVSGKRSFTEKLFAKYEKIKYTWKQIYDKIKHILENLAFYKHLLQDEDTKLLVSHASKRMSKILKSIRPRRLRANVLFGTGSPDTTGYAFGLYSMLTPKLGKHVILTPDFSQQILEGKLYAAGHLTVFHILWHFLSILFDKRLALLKQRLDAHSRKIKNIT